MAGHCRDKTSHVFGVKNAPPGFLEWAARMGAVSIESDTEWLAKLEEDRSRAAQSFAEAPNQ
jgi:hypothetical protein